MSDELVSVNLGEFLAGRMIAKIEAQPITIEYRLSDGTITEEITEKHPWYKELNRRRNEQVQRLRESLKVKPEIPV